MKTRLAQIHFDAHEIAQEYELITKHKQTKKKKGKEIRNNTYQFYMRQQR